MTDGPTTTPTPAAPETGAPPAAVAPPAPAYVPPATQQDLDRIVQDRVARERGKFSDYEELQAKAKQWDAKQQSELSDLEKERQRADAATAGQQNAETRITRLQVAIATGVPENLLTGTTEEELKASAQVALQWRGAAAPPADPVPPVPAPQVVYPPLPGQTPGGAPPKGGTLAEGAAAYKNRNQKG